MKVTSSKFVISAVGEGQYPQGDLPEFALAGRSNVGKSSFINKLIQRRNIARTSSKPGKTQTLNYYLINEMMYFVDVPGYGYAKVSKKERESWGEMIESYLLNRQQLQKVLLIVDLRHKPTADDAMMYEFLKHYQIPTLIVATKADKLKKHHLQKNLSGVRKTLQPLEGDKIIAFSAETGLGVDEVWNELKPYLP